MTRDRCKRTWEVEALVDGRLADKDRDSLDRHLATCAACSRALERTKRLSDVLTDLPVPDQTPLEARRQRAELLSQANGRIVETTSRTRRAASMVVGLAATVLILSMVVRGRNSTRSAEVATTYPSAPEFEVADTGHADFSSERVQSTSRVTLRKGTLALHVEHVKPGARFIVGVPDGEVEVRGTRFTVDVSDGHTKTVRVTEGVVELRLAGYRGLLRAGEAWPPAETAPEQPAGEPPVDVPTATPPTPSTPPADGGAAASSAPSTKSAVAAPAKPMTASGIPGTRFAEAMRAYNAGDYGEAERLLGAFVRDFPTDTRSEDAMFLIADARTRRGDQAGARAAAADYLQRYPNGLRAPTARRLLGADEPSAEH